MEDAGIVGGLAVLYATTLFAVYLVGDPLLWLLWATLAVLVTGSVLVALNR